MAMLVVTLAGVTWVVTVRSSPAWQPPVAAPAAPLSSRPDPAVVATNAPPLTETPLDPVSPWGPAANGVDSPSANEVPAETSLQALQRARSFLPQRPQQARRVIEERVAAGRATSLEVGFLRDLCETLHDDACVARCVKLVADRH